MGCVLVVGSINMDIVAFCEVSPHAGETVMGRQVEFFPGGKGSNQAIAAARIGAIAKLVGATGADAFGIELTANLSTMGVDIAQVRAIADQRTGTAIITVDASGQNRIVVVPGANLHVSFPKPIEPAGDGPIVALAQFETNLDVVERCFAVVRAEGGRTYLNPSPYRSIPEALVPSISGVIVNESEFAMLVDCAEQSDPVAVAELLRTRGDRFSEYIVTLGPNGCVVRDERGEIFHLPGHSVAVTDTTGAGDCFAGALAGRLSQGAGLKDAARYANMAAAISVTRAGAGRSAPSLREVEQLLDTL